MGVKINIHPILYQATGDQEEVEVDGTTVGEALDHLIARFPGVKDGLFDKDGKLHSYVDIYVNTESAYPEELAKPVEDGDELNIVVMIAGG